MNRLLRCFSHLLIAIGCISADDPLFGAREFPWQGVSTLSDEPIPRADTPIGAVHRLQHAYTHMQLEHYANVLTSDFCFVSLEPEFERRHPQGFTRDDEVASAAHLFGGFVDSSGVAHSGARFIQILVKDMSIGPDPAHSDSALHYALVRTTAQLMIELEDQVVLQAGPQLHAFFVVRGDAAVRAVGQAGDANGWHVRGWVENGDSASVAEWLATRRARGALAADNAGREGTALAIQGLRNPGTLPAPIELRLPQAGRVDIEIIDVAGRTMWKRAIDVNAGRHALKLGGSDRFSPGIYWVRVTLGREQISRRVVVLR